METKRITTTVSIHDLPEEVFRFLAQFLSGRDLDVCSDVCERWRDIFNSNKIWKRCCSYPEKYYKADTEFRLQECTRDKSSSLKMCLWKQYYKLEQSVCENWSKGHFSVVKSGIYIPSVSLLYDYVDDDGNHWLLRDNNTSGISIWDITRMPVSYGIIRECAHHFSFFHVGDKLVTFRGDYVRVFQFKPKKHELNLLYGFKFEMNSILPDDEEVSIEYYSSGARFIVTDQFLVGYRESITDIHKAFLHIWDLNSAKKMSTTNAVQQSYVDYLQSKSGKDDTDFFCGGIVLFSGSSRRFLINLIDDRAKLCRISLFSLYDLKFVDVIAEFESRTAWCFMEGEIITIFHLSSDETSILSVFNTNGQFLAKLDFSASYNPWFSGEFWFSRSKLILKLDDEKEVRILSISDSMEVSESSFEALKGTQVLCYYDPKFLLLCKKPGHYSTESVSVWDVESGLMLWQLESIAYLNVYRNLFKSTKYPRKLFVLFRGDKEMSILNFEKRVT